MTSQVKALVDKLLTNVSNMIKPEGYVSELILPEIKVKQSTGLIGKYGKGHLRIVNTFTGGKGQYAQLDSVTYNSTGYLIENHALKEIVTPQQMENVEKPFDAEKDAVTALTTHLWLGKEKALADQLSNIAVLTNNASPAVKYDNYTGAHTLLADVRVAKTSVKQKGGAPADTAIMSWEVAEALRYHPSLLDSLGFKEQRPGGLMDEEIARALGVKRVLIGGAVYNAAKLGQADDVQPVWGDVIIFATCPMQAALEQVSLGYRVQYAGRSPRQVYRSFVDEPVDSRKIMVVDDYDMVLVDVGAAYLLYNVLT